MPASRRRSRNSPRPQPRIEHRRFPFEVGYISTEPPTDLLGASAKTLFESEIVRLLQALSTSRSDGFRRRSRRGEGRDLGPGEGDCGRKTFDPLLRLRDSESHRLEALVHGLEHEIRAPVAERGVESILRVGEAIDALREADESGRELRRARAPGILALRDSVE